MTWIYFTDVWIIPMYVYLFNNKKENLNEFFLFQAIVEI